MVIKRIFGGGTGSGAIITPAGPFHFCRLDADDVDAVVRHFARLSDDDLRERYLGRIDRGAIETRYRTLDPKLNLLFGCCEGGEIFAVLQMSLAAFLPEAELGVTVEPLYRKRGIGSGLCELALALSAELGVRRAIAFCRRENVGARWILHTAGFIEDHTDPLIVAAWRDVEPSVASNAARIRFGSGPAVRGGDPPHHDETLRLKASLFRLSQGGWK